MDSFRFRFEDLDKLILAHDPRIVQQAQRSAIKKTTTKLRTFTKDSVRERYTVKAGRIASTASIELNFQDKNNPFTVLKYVGKKIGLINFGARTKKARITAKSGKKITRRVVTVKILKQERRKTIKSKVAFIFTGKNDNIHVFTRKGSARWPVISLKAPSVPQMVAHKSTMDRVDTFLGFELPAQFDHELEFFLLKKIGLR